MVIDSFEKRHQIETYYLKCQIAYLEGIVMATNQIEKEKYIDLLQCAKKEFRYYMKYDIEEARRNGKTDKEIIFEVIYPKLKNLDDNNNIDLNGYALPFSWNYKWKELYYEFNSYLKIFDNIDRINYLQNKQLPEFQDLLINDLKEVHIINDIYNKYLCYDVKVFFDMESFYKEIVDEFMTVKSYITADAFRVSKNIFKKIEEMYLEMNSYLIEKQQGENMTNLLSSFIYNSEQIVFYGGLNQYNSHIMNKREEKEIALEKARLEREKREKERKEKERIEKEKRERLERERLEREIQEQERLDLIEFERERILRELEEEEQVAEEVRRIKFRIQKKQNELKQKSKGFFGRLFS